MEPDVRDEVIDFVRTWSDKTALPKTRLVTWLGIGSSRYYDWHRRYGKVNEHHGLVPRDHWLLPRERETILAGYLEHRDEGLPAADVSAGGRRPRLTEAPHLRAPRSTPAHPFWVRG
jgi:hypothetical protein